MGLLCTTKPKIEARSAIAVIADRTAYDVTYGKLIAVDYS